MNGYSVVDNNSNNRFVFNTREIINLTFIKLKKASILESDIPCANDTSYAYLIFGNYDLLLIESKATNDATNLVNCIKNAQECLNDDNVEECVVLPLLEVSSTNEKEKDIMDFFKQGCYFLISFIDLIDPLWVAEKVGNDVRCQYNFDAFKRCNTLKKLIDAKNSSLTHVPFKIFVGLGRYELVLVTNLEFSGSKEQKPINNAIKFLKSLNNILMADLGDQKKTLLVNDIHSMFAIKSETQPNKEKAVSKSLNVSENISAFCFVALDQYLSNTQLFCDDKKKKKAYPIFGYYDFLCWFECNIDQLNDRILELRKNIDETARYISTYTYITTSDTPTIPEELSCSEYNSLKWDVCKPKCNNCEIKNGELKSETFQFAVKKLLDIDVLIRKFSENVLTESMLRGMCSKIKAIALLIKIYSHFEDEKKENMELPLFYSGIIPHLKSERKKYRENLFNQLSILQFAIQQRLSYIFNLKVTNESATILSKSLVSFEQILFAAESFCYYTCKHFKIFNDNLNIFKEREWPNVIIGFDSSFTLLPPGFINVPDDLLFEVQDWAGIIHETVHYILFNYSQQQIKDTFELFDRIINQHLHNIEDLSSFNWRGLLVELFVYLVVLIVGFNFEIYPFLVSTIKNVGNIFFSWNNFAILVLCVAFYILHKVNEKNNEHYIPISEILKMELSAEAVSGLTEESVQFNELFDFLSGYIVRLYACIHNKVLGIYDNPILEQIIRNVTKEWLLFNDPNNPNNEREALIDRIYKLLIRKGSLLRRYEKKEQLSTSEEMSIDPSAMLIKLNSPKSETSWKLTLKRGKSNETFEIDFKIPTSIEDIKVKDKLSYLIKIINWFESELINL